MKTEYTLYRAKPRHLTAYCYADGVIAFTSPSKPYVPKGGLPIVSGPAALLRRTIDATSRLAYDGKTLIVPGVPEAKLFKRDPLQALLDHIKWLLKRPGLYKTPVVNPKRKAARTGKAVLERSFRSFDKILRATKA